MSTSSSWLSPTGDTLLLPIYTAVFSLILLSSGVVWNSRTVTKLRVSVFKASIDPHPTENPQSHFGTSLANHVETHGGGTIFAFKLMRLLGCFILLGLSSAAVLLDDEDKCSLGLFGLVGALTAQVSPEYLGTTPLVIQVASPRLVIQLALCALYFYATLLTMACLSAHTKLSQKAASHVNAVLGVTLLVYGYRDIFPLATYTLSPLDVWEGRLLWTKITVLLATAAAVPLVMPRQYIPLDPKNPMPVPNEEQTASIFSLAFYFFLDPIVQLAARVPHLPFDDLPPLCDYDASHVLRKRALLRLETSKRRHHLGFSLIWLFRWEFFQMAILLVLSALTKFLAPLAINRILDYVENPTADRIMKPWFWILTLFFGPLFYSVVWQWDIFVGTHIMAQTTSIITQLLYDHALRIRIKAGTSGTSTGKKAEANLMGRINTLATVDLGNINEARNILFLIVLIPIQVVTSIVFLYQLLGWSAFVGAGLMIALFPLPGYAAKLLSSFQRRTLEKTDARVQMMTEVLGVLRMIKMFGWERQMKDKITEKRMDELVWVWWSKAVLTIESIISNLVPVTIMLGTYATLLSTLIMKQELSASIVFSSMAVFDVLRVQIGFALYCIGFTVRAKVSLERVDEFLRNTELLDSIAKDPETAIEVLDEPPNDIIGFREARFSWAAAAPTEVDGTATPSGRNFVLHVPGELIFKRGAINLVVGPTGSGKTSLLMALLGEMHATRAGPASWYNLPREGGVAFAAQESWVLNDTIKNNILFHAPYDAQRYQQVLYQCGLEPDLKLFGAGDETEVGEHGRTLSGGQRARVTLARAIYSFSEIVLLDDVLAALDVHTARWIVDKCLRGPLVAGRTIILVTHNIALTKDLASFVVSVGLDGRARGEASISAALAHDQVLAEEAIRDEEAVERFDEKIDETTPEPEKPDGKLIVAEEIEVGRVSLEATRMFLDAHSPHPYFFFISLLVIIFLLGFVSRAETWLLGYWASQYGQGVAVAAVKYISIYGAVVLISNAIQSIAYTYFSIGSYNASKVIHTKLLNNVFGTTFRWLDSTPTSRIIARFTGDINTIDDNLSERLWDLLHSTVGLVTQLLAVVLFTPIFLIPGVLVALLGIWFGRIYLAAQLSRTGINPYSSIGVTMSGLVSVRAYGAQDTFVRISMEKIDRLTRIQRTFANLNRWVTARIDFINLALSVLLAYYLVYLQKQSPLNIGFTLSMAIAFSGGILNWVYLGNTVEVNSNSLERVKQFIDIEQEPAPTDAGVPPAYWPASGDISVKGLSARYSATGPNVLHEMSFDVRSGERVGVVGRTGAGKSSLTLALLRCILVEGTVYYDGIATSSLNLDALRANITIIPQAPELFAGSLRANIDILGQFDDTVLNDALRSAGLTALQADMEEGSARLTLDTEVNGSGNNLSLGQRQIVALARAIVRDSKLLILDEATSAIDYKTDNAIQTSLRTELPKDTTIITVAHRLASVMDADKIMVLDTGKIVEFDTPQKLLNKPNGYLRALVEESGNKGELYAMAGVESA
uniref:ATP-binding cassette transporter n=1 Tax=Mycena chlorophos TaxID=658473 RepID=A0ABQ0KWS3_MYCCL|nr:ATP-binding cassette transporter [Mycena chlorophos]